MHGIHARSAIGVQALPLGLPVIIDGLVEIELFASQIYSDKLSIRLSIYKSGANREEMDDVLYT